MVGETNGLCQSTPSWCLKKDEQKRKPVLALKDSLLPPVSVYVLREKPLGI